MTIEFNEDIIDFNDIIERYEELKDQLESLTGKDQGDFGSFDYWIEYAVANPPESLPAIEYEELLEELQNLRQVIDETQGYGGDVQYEGNWYPGVLVNEDYFVDYAKQLVEDCGDVPSNLPWYIERHIDWEGVADDIKQDYGSITVAHSEYYYR